MAIYYYLAVACTSESAATEMAHHFDGLLLTLSGGLTIPCRANPIWDFQRAWWIEVRPYGAGINGFEKDGQPEPNLTTRDHRSEIGHLLYQHLHKAPSFEYAQYVEEALDCFFDARNEQNVVLHDPKALDPGWDGLVIKSQLLDLFRPSDHYQAFRPGYVWRPFVGKNN